MVPNGSELIVKRSELLAYVLINKVSLSLVSSTTLARTELAKMWETQQETSWPHKYLLPKHNHLVRSNSRFTCQAAGARCCSHPVQRQEDQEAEVEEQSCPPEVEAAAHQHHWSEIRLAPSGSGSSRRTAVAGVEQRVLRRLHKLP
jgi:hypothetical protein